MKARVVIALCVALTSLLALPGDAFAKPTNDNYKSATTIRSLPFNQTLSTATATSETGEPGCGAPNNSVWYTYKADTNQVIRVNTIGSSYDARAIVYAITGRDFGGLTSLGCSSGANRPLDLAAGTSYAIQVYDESPAGGGGTLVLSVRRASPPANDDFANATTVSPLPFAERIDLAAASVQADEPIPGCVEYPPLLASAWYSYTPSVDGQLQVSWQAGFEALDAIYTGASLSQLTFVSCGPASIAVQGGIRYFVQIAAQGLGKGEIDITMRQPPPPNVDFGWNPAEPDSLQKTSFFDETFDPGFTFRSDAWSFGDGSTATGPNPTHQYAADGDYTATLEITTTDGRTGSAQHVVSVRTHDLSVSRVSAPGTAVSGQMRTVTVSVVNGRYPETADVALYRGDPAAGGALVGSTEVSVPVTTKNPSNVAFSYTFTEADASDGQVQFVATVTIVGHTDAQPGDNSGTAVTRVVH
jgi:PKD domain-containing protein